MSTKYPEVFRALGAEIPPEQIRYRQQRGEQIGYIPARVAQIRLDEVLGPENWSARWRIVETIAKDNAKVVTVIANCTVRIRVGDHVITRTDTGGASNPDPVVARKGAVSDSFKRACALFGIGRELYGSGIAEYEADELASYDLPPAVPPRAEEPARPRPSERKAEEKKKAPVADTKLAGLVTVDQYKEFQAWREGFIAEEKDRLQARGADPETGELPPGWKVEVNAFLLTKHFIEWLKDRGTLGDVGSDGAIKAKCVAWVWANKRAEFDAELAQWREQLAAEATAWRAKPRAEEPTASQLPPPAPGPSPFDEGRANPLDPAELASDGEVADMRDFLAEFGERRGAQSVAVADLVHARMVAAGLTRPGDYKPQEKLNQIALARVFWRDWLKLQFEAVAQELGSAIHAA